MDQDRFDALSRTVAAKLPRRSLAGLAAAALAALGAGPVGAKGRKGRADREPAERGRRGNGGDEERGRTADRDAAAAGEPGAAGKKKPNRCVPPGGSCKKPKKGKAPKCCAGLACDPATKRCVVGDVAIDAATLEACLAPDASGILATLRASCGGACAEPGEECAACQADALAGHAETVAPCLATAAIAADSPVAQAVRRVGGVRPRSANVGRCKWSSYEDRMGAAQENLLAQLLGAGVSGAALAAALATPLTGPALLAAVAAYATVAGVKQALNGVVEVDHEVGCWGTGGFCKPGPAVGGFDGICCPVEDAAACGDECCDPHKCEACKDGACAGCDLGDYCAFFAAGSAGAVECARCPTCADHGDVCGVFDDRPDNAVAGSPGCPRLFCDGACPPGEVCEHGECVPGDNPCADGNCTWKGFVQRTVTLSYDDVAPAEGGFLSGKRTEDEYISRVEVERGGTLARASATLRTVWYGVGSDGWDRPCQLETHNARDEAGEASWAEAVAVCPDDPSPGNPCAVSFGPFMGGPELRTRGTDTERNISHCCDAGGCGSDHTNAYDVDNPAQRIRFALGVPGRTAEGAWALEGESNDRDGWPAWYTVRTTWSFVASRLQG